MADTSLQKQLRRLRQSIIDSRSLLQEVHDQRFETVQAYVSTPITVSPLHLDIPVSFYTTIQSYRLNHYVYEALSNAINGLKSDYTQQFDDSCQKLAQATKVPQLDSLLPNLIEKLRHSVQNHFETRGLPKLLEDLEAFAKAHPSRSSPPPQTTQPQIPPYQPPVPFNNEYTPILETYFHYDPYPSVRDRQIIAERSGMATRQIEVWFQNHRKRAREQGLSLPSRRPSEGVDTFIGSEKARMLDLFNRSPNPNSRSSSDSNSSRSRSRSSSPGSATGPFTPSPTSTNPNQFNYKFDFKSPSPSPSPWFPMKSGSGTTPEDPIQIGVGVGEGGIADTVDVSMNVNVNVNEPGMMITSVGNGVGVVEPVDVVERVEREKEKEKERSREKERRGRRSREMEINEMNEMDEYEMREQKIKFLSILSPPTFRAPLQSSFSSSNPLESNTSTSPETTFPAPSVRPPVELQFRYRVAPSLSSPASRSTSTSPPSSPPTPTPIKGTIRPILPLPTWPRIAPATSYQIPPPPTSLSTLAARSKSRSKSKSKSDECGRKGEVKEEGEDEDEGRRRALEVDEEEMMIRLGAWRIDDDFDDDRDCENREDEGTMDVDVEMKTEVEVHESSSSSKSKSPSPSPSIKPKSKPTTTPKSSPKSPTRSKIEGKLRSLGVGIDAATCAYTYVLPKAPFWALVRGGGSTGGGGVSIEGGSSSSLTRKTMKKPSALGPKRKPRNAPSSSPATFPGAVTVVTGSGSSSASQAGLDDPEDLDGLGGTAWFPAWFPGGYSRGIQIRRVF
ncbi:hypothetical protein GGU10DRAFT_415833 [Lentinula aff. detonsa]|uniref:Homeobox domain-containing protein n=1 Tax=Lentinula aff. detonsa TaxID=2804958 RepID=A0AA38L1T2_9AGAR|nr:hypothetical protein GGU10DRAFT_415833 [Lentinula aff. detonsa]